MATSDEVGRSPSGQRDRLVFGALALVLVASVWTVYGQTLGFEFVVFDDDRYVYQNDFVTQGLGLESVGWALTGPHWGNWHPVTSLSHIFDWHLAGEVAGWHHAVNVSLHAVNAVLLFTALRLLTGALSASFVVALLFALHPMHVESVAWISSRKDMLSGAFAFLTIIAYTRWAREPSRRKWTLVLLAYGFGLMSKPMLVTLPILLMLLDFWPLERLTLRDAAAWRARAAEKLPLFALAALSSIATLWVQNGFGAIQSTSRVPIAWRFLNSLDATALYLRKAIWPIDLACFYPHPALGPDASLAEFAGGALAAGLLLIALTALALRLGRRVPAVAVGWLWFLISLVPVIGWVQVGNAALADRYAYLPYVGLYTAVSFGFASGAARGVHWRRIIAGITAIVAVGLAAQSVRQAATWRDSESLFTHAIAVTDENATARSNLGAAYAAGGRLADAEAEFRRAMELDANDGDPVFNLGVVLSQQGRFDEAADAYMKAVVLEPGDFAAQLELGATLGRLGRYSSADHHLRLALALRPGDPEARRLLRQVEALRESPPAR